MSSEEPSLDIEQAEDSILNSLKLGLTGDERSFNQFVAESTSRLKSRALNILENDAHADDVLQKVYLKIWNKRENLINQPLTWNFLYTIVRNQCLTEIRNQKIKKENYSIDSEISELTERPATEPNPEERVLLKEEINRVKQIIDQMHPTYQEILDIQLDGGQTNKQISESTGFNIVTVRKALFNLRRKLGLEKRNTKPKA